MNARRHVRTTAILACLAALILAATPGLAEVYYIDPGQPGQGCSPAPTYKPEASLPAGHLCGSWGAVRWADGNSYYQKGGSTSTQGIVIEGQTFSKGITLSSYGPGKATIDMRGRGTGLALRDVSNVHVSNLAIANPGWAGVLVHPRTRTMTGLSFDGIEVRNSLNEQGGGGWGFFTEPNRTMLGLSGLKVTNSAFKNCARHAVYISGRIKDVLFQNNVVEAGNLGSQPYFWGACINGLSHRSADGAGITLTRSSLGAPGANVWSLPSTQEVLDVAVHYPGKDYGFLRKGASTATLKAGEWIYSAADRCVYVALGGRVNPNDLDDNPANGQQRMQVIAIYGWAEDVVVRNNCFLGTRNNSHGEASGFGFEFGVRNSVVENNASVNNQGCGYSFLASRNIRVAGNVSCGNGLDGYHFNVVDGAVVQGNLSVRDSAMSGRHAAFGLRNPFSGVQFRGNAAVLSQAYGFANSGGQGGLVSDANQAQGSRLGDWQSWQRSGTDRTVNAVSGFNVPRSCQDLSCGLGMTEAQAKNAGLRK